MLLALLPLTALAADPEVGFSIEPLVAVDTHRRGTEDHTETWTWIRAQASQRTASGRWFLAVQADHNVRFGEDREGIWSMRVGESGWAGDVGTRASDPPPAPLRRSWLPPDGLRSHICSVHTL